MLSRFNVLRRSTLAGGLIVILSCIPAVGANAMAQTPAAAPAAAGRQLGTVKIGRRKYSDADNGRGARGCRECGGGCTHPAVGAR